MKVSKVVASTIATLITLSVSALSQTTTTPNVYVQTNLVSNQKNTAAVFDKNLIDPWGVSISSGSPFWVSNHLSGTSTLYNGAGTITPLVVTVPPGSASPSGSLGRPTGQVNNSFTTGTPVPFLLPAPNGKTASFIFATDDGTISAWNSSVTANTAVIVVDNSSKQAVYKSLAIGNSAGGPTIYAANFRSGQIEAYNSLWAPATLAGTFSDSMVPAGFAPFNIWNLGNKLYVTYAMQDANKFLDVGGAGNGYVAVFDLNGNLLTHLVSQGALNSPWGLAIAPKNWGPFGGALLVGNFGDGKINAYDATAGAWLGALMGRSGVPLVNQGLWALIFGNGKNGGDTNTLYFTAGVPNGSTTPNGLFGSIAPPAAITAITNAASLLGGLPVSPGEIVLITGQTVGPSPSVTSPIPGPGSLPTTVLGTNPVNSTTVTFNGVAAPIVYAGAAGTSVQVPYEVAGSSSANVVLTVGAQIANAFTVPVAPTAPGIFTLNFTGTGDAVAVNPNGTLNSPSNPVARLANLKIYATGEGVTMPADVNGIVEPDNSRIPVAPAFVTFNTVNGPVVANTVFAKDVAGVLEITVTVPINITPGLSNVLLTSGGVTTTQVTDVYVK
ncbi:MAG TPA: TIGR03118 family protein [Bryobacteraceae bacterium]|nr:TIGR03118 family protein [Bryobacteraceae bacterium]